MKMERYQPEDYGAKDRNMLDTSIADVEAILEAHGVDTPAGYSDLTLYAYETKHLCVTLCDQVGFGDQSLFVTIEFTNPAGEDVIDNYLFRGGYEKPSKYLGDPYEPNTSVRPMTTEDIIELASIVDFVKSDPKLH